VHRPIVIDVTGVRVDRGSSRISSLPAVGYGRVLDASGKDKQLGGVEIDIDNARACVPNGT
jgi:hypothetical protein